MAFGPKEKRDKQLEETRKIADLLEKEIDQQLTDKTVEVSSYSAEYLWILFKNHPLKEAVQEEVKRRFVEKGWKDVQFE